MATAAAAASDPPLKEFVAMSQVRALPQTAFPVQPGTTAQGTRRSSGDFTGSRAVALAAALLIGSTAVPALAATYPITDDQKATAERVASSGVALADLAPGAPDQYSVKTGDTLWAIASLYLKSPWRWPELWGMNREQVHNPHLIYPGQQLMLVKGPDGKAHLVLNGNPGDSFASSGTVSPDGTTVRLSPRIRDAGSASGTAISSIPNNLIEPFLSRPEVLPEADMNRLARIMSTPEDRVFLGRGDSAYARGLTDPRIENFNVLRPAQPLFEPDDTDHRHPIAYEASYLGTVRVTRPGDVSTLTVTSSQQEMGVGDRLLPIEHQPLINYVPHHLDRPIVGRIVSVYSGVHSVGAGSIVTIDRGSRDGLEIGHVLGVFHDGGVVTDRTSPEHDRVRLPNEKVGALFVFRIFEGISYGLLMTATGPIQVGDWISQPDEPLAVAQP